ncbi:hypothetical protein Hanom_Chr11g01041571 [Helianthus anomalus]
MLSTSSLITTLLLASSLIATICDSCVFSSKYANQTLQRDMKLKESAFLNFITHF